MPPLLTLHDDALAGPTFRRLLRRVRALGSERLKQTYQTTFWFDPNRYVLFRGDLTHGVLDAHNQLPHRRLPGPSRLRLALVVNYWQKRPTDVPTFAASRHYRSLAVPPARRSP